MSRSLKIRKPRATEVQQLQVVIEDEVSARQRRRAEAIVLYAAGLQAVEIAKALGVHIKTVYADLHRPLAYSASRASGSACEEVPPPASRQSRRRRSCVWPRRLRAR